MDDSTTSSIRCTQESDRDAIPPCDILDLGDQDDSPLVLSDTDEELLLLDDDPTTTERNPDDSTTTNLFDMDTLNDSILDNISLDEAPIDTNSTTDHPTAHCPTTMTTISQNSNYATNNNSTVNDKEDNTHNEQRNINNLPPHLLSTFRLLNSLKRKRDSTTATLTDLNTHITNNTIPDGLRIKHKCHLDLPPALKTRWERTLQNASNELLTIMNDHHQTTLHNTNSMIQKHTDHLTEQCNDRELTTNIIRTSNEMGTLYAKQQLQRKTKPKSRRHRTTSNNRSKTNKKNTITYQNNNTSVHKTQSTHPSHPHTKNTHQNNNTYSHRTWNTPRHNTIQTINSNRIPSSTYTPLPGNNNQHDGPTTQLTRTGITQHIQQGIQDFLLSKHTLHIQ